MKMRLECGGCHLWIKIFSHMKQHSATNCTLIRSNSDQSNFLSCSSFAGPALHVSFSFFSSITKTDKPYHSFLNSFIRLEKSLFVKQHASTSVILGEGQSLSSERSWHEATVYRWIMYLTQIKKKVTSQVQICWLTYRWPAKQPICIDHWQGGIFFIYMYIFDYISLYNSDCNIRINLTLNLKTEPV